MTKKEFFERYKIEQTWFYCDICMVNFKEKTFSLVIKQIDYDEFTGETDKFEVEICENCFMGDSND